MIQPVRCSFLADRGPERPTSCGNPGSQLLYACHSLSLPPDGAAYLQKISLGCWVNDGNKGYIPEGLWRNQGPGGRRSRTGAIRAYLATAPSIICSVMPAASPSLPKLPTYAATHLQALLDSPGLQHTFHAHSLTHFIGQAQVPETQGLPRTGTNPHSQPFHI